MDTEPVLSRHRLPRFYRYSLTALWLAPALILLLTLALHSGFDPALFDLRLLLPLALMMLPALYVWHEGVDVLPGGIVRRVHLPRYYAYRHLETWYYDHRPDRRTLIIWDADNRKVLECRAGHLTDMPLLLRALKSNIRYRHWPY